MFKAQSKEELTKFINIHKSASSHLVKCAYPRVKQFIWKKHSGQKAFVYR